MQWLVPGAVFAILAMTIATYLCRISGVALMGLVPLTPRVRRGLAALPGSIVVATVLPLIERTGPAAGLALAASLLMMLWRRNEILSLVTGLAVVTVARASGF
ncbi:MAG: AzlD family protein [Bosea sp. (in: a-proteobacteria)]